uniref:Salivary secreted protein n=2 Tax=Triatoma infestans TaxID=30076 RepID=A0A170YKG8_TRIIF
MDAMFKNIWTINAFFLAMAIHMVNVIHIQTATPYCLQHYTYDLYLGQEPTFNKTHDVFTSKEKFERHVTWKFVKVQGSAKDYKVINDFENHLLAIDKFETNQNEAKVITRAPDADDDSNIWTIDVEPSHAFLINKFSGQYLYAPNNGAHNLAFTRPLAPVNQSLFKWQVIDCSS